MSDCPFSIVRRKKSNPYWYVRFKDEGGKSAPWKSTQDKPIPIHRIRNTSMRLADRLVCPCREVAGRNTLPRKKTRNRSIEGFSHANKIADARKECASSGVRRRTEGSMTFEQVSFCSGDAFPACG